MNSSTSSSDTRTSQVWRRFVTAYVLTLVCGLIGLYAFIVISDPFSTGRLTPFNSFDIAYSGRVYANVGRTRDPSFDSAILGNSVSTRFQPELLDPATDRRFAQLSIPGLGPDNELTLARAFVRGHGAGTRTVVFVLEPFWCVTDMDKMHRYPNFANWLYEGDNLTYLREMFSLDTAQAAFHRTAIRLGLAPEAARRDGYVPREGRGVWQPDWVAKRARPKRPTAAPPRPWTFVAIERLHEFRRSLDPSVEMVMLIMPFHVSELPEPGSDAQHWLAACKARAKVIADTEPRTILVDRMVEDDIARDATNFWDGQHVRDSIFRSLETELGAALRAARQSDKWQQ